MPDFNKEAADSKYVYKTYTFVTENINLSTSLHHLALLLAIIFSKLCPNVFTEATSANLLSPLLASTEESAQQYLNTLPWSNRLAAGKKGNTRRDLYICMVTTYIISLYEPKSPIRLHHDSSGQFGRWWTEKHSELHLCQKQQQTLIHA